ncbi:hypothetical protein ACFS07_26225 [Undibacterium arcticum]
MRALGRGDLDAAHASVSITPVRARSRDEVGAMAASFNLLQCEVANAATGLDGAREGLRQARHELTNANWNLKQRVGQLRQVEEKNCRASLTPSRWWYGPSPPRMSCCT